MDAAPSLDAASPNGDPDKVEEKRKLEQLNEQQQKQHQMEVEQGQWGSQKGFNGFRKRCFYVECNEGTFC